MEASASYTYVSMVIWASHFSGRQCIFHHPTSEVIQLRKS
jgi:hypothetical protein